MKNSIVIFDIDGTLADCSHRLPFIKTEGEKKDWKSFFARTKEDLLISHTAKIYGILHRLGWYLPVITGRPEKLRQDTLDWFKDHYLPLKTENLHMRPDKDNRPDYEVKKDLFFSLKILPEDVLCAFEDRPQVIDMWKDLGISVLNCGDET